MAVFGYARVSTERQAEIGLSLSTQERTIRGYADMIGVEAPLMFIERGVSGSIPLADRPQGAELMRRVGLGDVVITPRLDRCFRSASDALSVLNDLKVRGANLHMIDLGGDVTSNGISKLVFTILSAVAEAERDRTRERIREVKSDQKRKGFYLGGSVPIGCKVSNDGKLLVTKARGALECRVRALRKDGLSLRAISDCLDREGVRISHVAVAKLLRDSG